MPKETTINVFKRDNTLLDYLKSHKGKENIVTAKEIAKFLNSQRWAVKSDLVHCIVRKIMYERNAPICHLNAKGYYWASNRAEIKNTIADIENRISSLQEHINHLNNFILD